MWIFWVAAGALVLYLAPGIPAGWRAHGEAWRESAPAPWRYQPRRQGHARNAYCGRVLRRETTAAASRFWLNLLTRGRR